MGHYTGTVRTVTLDPTGRDRLIPWVTTYSHEVGRVEVDLPPSQFKSNLGVNMGYERIMVPTGALFRTRFL